MIKGIIEKLIMNTFGKFIKGIEKDKLSVDLFGGNFKLENISLNHEYFDNLNTPFKLAYSSIGKLNLQVIHHTFRHPFPNFLQSQSNAFLIISLLYYSLSKDVAKLCHQFR